jgi:hypothetical protein
MFRLKNGVAFVVVFSVVVAAPAICLALSGTSDAYTIGHVAHGRSMTITNSAYISAAVQTYLNGAIGDWELKMLYPNSFVGFLIATAANDMRQWPNGEYFFEVYGWHEASECVTGISKEIYLSDATETFENTNGIRVWSDNTQETETSIRVRHAHEMVERFLEIDKDNYLYFSYKDREAIAADRALFASSYQALAFLRAAIEIELAYLRKGDMAPGYWISKCGQRAIVGTRREDGSMFTDVLRPSSEENGLVWLRVE